MEDVLLNELKAMARRRHRSAGEGRRREHLAALAKELGFDGWPHLVAVLTGKERERFGTLFYPPGTDGHFNIWSADYGEARRIRYEHGGWLLPYRHQYLIVDRHFLETVGLDPDDPDWQRMGRDWLAAESLPARQRLCEQLVRARAARLEG